MTRAELDNTRAAETFLSTNPIDLSPLQRDYLASSTEIRATTRNHNSSSPFLPAIMLAQAPSPDSNRGVVDAPAIERQSGNPFRNRDGVVSSIAPRELTEALGRAWDGLARLNQALSGQRPEQYQAITNGTGNPAVVNRPQERTQTVPFVLDGRTIPVEINLPGFRGNSVGFATDGRHVLAIDPANNDVWMLQRETFFGNFPSYSWNRISRR
jgi:hypothetical protein